MFIKTNGEINFFPWILRSTLVNKEPDSMLAHMFKDKGEHNILFSHFVWSVCSCIDIITPVLLYFLMTSVIFAKVKTHWYVPQFFFHKFLTLFFDCWGLFHFNGNTGVWGNKQDHRGAFLIDRSPEYFEPILNYLRHGQLIVNDGINLLGEFYYVFSCLVS